MKKMISLCLVVINFVSGAVFAAGGNLPGNGTEASPFVIEDLADFIVFSNNPSYWDDYNKLDADIDISSTGDNADGSYSKAIISPDEDYALFGYQGTEFSGVFDGDGHTVYGMDIYIDPNVIDSSDPSGYIGFFGLVTGEVDNLKVMGDVTVFPHENDSLWHIGGMIGCAGKYNNSALISNSHFYGDVFAYGNCIGGFVGSSTSEIVNCSSTGKVTGRSWTYENTYDISITKYSNNIGGFVGSVTRYYGCSSVVKNSSSNSEVFLDKIRGGQIGGFVGSVGSAAKVESCNCVSVVETVCPYEASGLLNFIGGFAGRLNNALIDNCKVNTSIQYSGDKISIGGLVGYLDYESGVTNSKSEGSLSVISIGGRNFDDENIGGLVGNSVGGISNSCAVIDIDLLYNVTNDEEYDPTQTRFNVGGLVGNAARNINNCYSKGSIEGELSASEIIYGTNSQGEPEIEHLVFNVGGLVGKNVTKIENSYSITEINLDPNSNNTDVTFSIGAFCGELGWHDMFGVLDDIDAYIYNSNYNIDINVGLGGIGYGNSTGLYSRTSSQMQDIDTYIYGGEAFFDEILGFTIDKWDFDAYGINGDDDIWFMPENNYPVLTWEVMPGRWKLQSIDDNGDSFNGYQLNDFSKNNNDGSLIDLSGDGVTAQAESGKDSNCLKFDRVVSNYSLISGDEYIVTPCVLNPANSSFTAMAWVKGGETYNKILCQGDGAGVGRAWLQINSYDCLGSVVGGEVMSTVYWPELDDVWHHVCLVWNGMKRKIYLDGVLVGEDVSNISMESCDGEMYIGAHKGLDTAVSSFWNGSLDEVRIYNIALSESQIRQRFIQYGELAKWTFESIVYDSLGGNYLTCDSSGNDFDAICFNGISLAQVNGSNSLYLDGVDDYCKTPYILNPSHGQFSVMAWVKGGAIYQKILCQSDGTGVGRVWLQVNINERIGTVLKSDTSSYLEANSNWSTFTNDWHNVCFVWSGSTRKLYIDGSLVASDLVDIGNLEDCDGQLFIGAHKALGSGFFWNGYIDDIAIYPIGLSSDEISKILN